MKQTRPYCLASSSPRRRELLARLGLEFTVFAAEVDERILPRESPPAYVERMAWQKAAAGKARFADHLILAGDTVVVLDGDILGKPRDGSEAKAMISRLSGKTHRVLSAYSLLDGPSSEQCGGAAVTRVTFRKLPPEWIAWYAGLPEALDKAGAYAIQGVGGAMVERIEGSYNNVVGFPVEEIVWDLLRKGWAKL